MAFLRVRFTEGEDVQPILLWDSVWSPWAGYADWAIAESDETQNRGGLRAKGALHTAVVIALFTDRRMPADHPLAYLVAGDDPRGWWGDGEDIHAELGEGEMGSLLWAFERAHLNEDIRRWVEAVAVEALAPLIFQGVCARVDVTATRPVDVNRVNLEVNLYGRAGTIIFTHRFDDIWQQAAIAPAAKTFATSSPPV
jgi:phage gp46-like protein